MAQALGSRGSLSIQEEDVAYKSAPTTPNARKIYFKNESLRLARNLITSETITGSREATKPVLGNVNVSGDISVELQGAMELLLYGVMGQVTTATHKRAYTSTSGSFINGETVTGNTSTKTAVVVCDDTTNDVLYFVSPSGAFQAETITGASSGSTATIGGDLQAVSGSYAHRFTIGTNLPSFLIEKGFEDLTQYFKYQGCKFNSMSLSVVPEGFQDVSFSVIGAKETVSGTPYDSSVTDNGKSSFDGFSISTLNEGGSAIANVTTIDGLTIENNLDDSVYVIDPLNPGERASLPAGIVKVSGKLTALFENLTLYNKAIANTESSLKISYKLGTGAGTDGNEYLEINIPELIFSPNAPVIEGGSGVKVDLPFEAYYDNHASASTIDIVVRNAVATV